MHAQQTISPNLKQIFQPLRGHIDEIQQRILKLLATLDGFQCDPNAQTPIMPGHTTRQLRSSNTKESHHNDSSRSENTIATLNHQLNKLYIELGDLTKLQTTSHELKSNSQLLKPSQKQALSFFIDEAISLNIKPLLEFYSLLPNHPSKSHKPNDRCLHNNLMLFATHLHQSICQNSKSSLLSLYIAKQLTYRMGRILSPTITPGNPLQYNLNNKPTIESEARFLCFYILNQHREYINAIKNQFNQVEASIQSEDCFVLYHKLAKSSAMLKCHMALEIPSLLNWISLHPISIAYRAISIFDLLMQLSSAFLKQNVAMNFYSEFTNNNIKLFPYVLFSLFSVMTTLLAGSYDEPEAPSSYQIYGKYILFGLYLAVITHSIQNQNHSTEIIAKGVLRNTQNTQQRTYLKDLLATSTILNSKLTQSTDLNILSQTKQMPPSSTHWTISSIYNAHDCSKIDEKLETPADHMKKTQ